jgi:hypothetical protein
MKIIEAMKKVKHLQEKCADLQAKVALYHADLSHETPVYPDQRAQISEWIQSHFDSVQEIGRLRTAIQRTNIATQVTIEFTAKVSATKSIAEWVHRRRDLAKLDLAIWSKLNDKSLREGAMQGTGGNITPVTIRRYYDPRQRDDFMALYQMEPGLIDSRLEVVNATTDLVD